MRITYSFVLLSSMGIIGALVSAVMIAGASPAEVKGDMNCDGSVNPIDSLLVLRHDAGLAVNLPPGCDAIGSTGGSAAPSSSGGDSKGDMNCDGSVNPIDSLLVLRHDAGLAVNLPPGCDVIGSNVSTPTPEQTLPDRPSFTAVPTATQPPATPTPTPTPTAAAATQTPVTSTPTPTATPTPTPTATPAPTATATPTSQTFGDGTWIIGLDIQPGLWRNDDSSDFCYWARLSGLGGELDDIISNEFSSIIQTVEIKPSDLAFEADRCGTWSQILQPPSSGPSQPFGNGTWLVGEEIAPGIWRNSDSSDDCYWARLSGFGGSLFDIIANEFDDSIQTVEIKASDVGFSASRCGTWSQTLTPPSSGPTQPFGPGVWLVGEEVSPGIWRNSDSSESCYWERRSGLGGTFGEIIDNGFSTAIQTVVISASDVAFYSHRCGTWIKIG